MGLGELCFLFRMKVFMIQSMIFSFKDFLFYCQFLKITLAQSQHIHTSRKAPVCPSKLLHCKRSICLDKQNFCAITGKKKVTFCSICEIWSSMFLILISLYILWSSAFSGSEDEASSVEELMALCTGILVRWRKWANAWSICGVTTGKVTEFYQKERQPCNNDLHAI